MKPRGQNFGQGTTGGNGSTCHIVHPPVQHTVSYTVHHMFKLKLQQFIGWWWGSFYTKYAWLLCAPGIISWGRWAFSRSAQQLQLPLDQRKTDKCMWRGYPVKKFKLILTYWLVSDWQLIMVLNYFEAQMDVVVFFLETTPAEVYLACGYIFILSYHSKLF